MDSGCNASIFAARLIKPNDFYTVSPRITAFDGSVTNLRGAARVRVQWGGKKVEVEGIVSNNLIAGVDVILGLDVMRFFCVTIDRGKLAVRPVPEAKENVEKLPENPASVAVAPRSPEGPASVAVAPRSPEGPASVAVAPRLPESPASAAVAPRVETSSEKETFCEASASNPSLSADDGLPKVSNLCAASPRAFFPKKSVSSSDGSKSPEALNLCEASARALHSSDDGEFPTKDVFSGPGVDHPESPIVKG